MMLHRGRSRDPGGAKTPHKGWRGNVLSSLFLRTMFCISNQTVKANYLMLQNDRITLNRKYYYKIPSAVFVCFVCCCFRSTNLLIPTY